MTSTFQIHQTFCKYHVSFAHLLLQELYGLNEILFEFEIQAKRDETDARYHIFVTYLT